MLSKQYCTLPALSGTFALLKLSMKKEQRVNVANKLCTHLTAMSNCVEPDDQT